MRCVITLLAAAAALFQNCIANSAEVTPDDLVLNVTLTEKHFISPDDLVLNLTEETFDDALSTHSFLVVEFYAPWCQYCKNFAPEYKKAALVLANQIEYIGETITLAKVDATVQKSLSTRFDIRSFPTIKIFEGGSDKPSDYEGPYDAEGIVAFLKGRAGPASTEVRTEEEAKALIEDSLVIVVYTDSDVDGWLKFAQSMRGKAVFVHTAADSVKVAFGIDAVKQKILVVKKFDENLVEFDGSLSDQDKLVSWINLHRFELGVAIRKGDKATMQLFFENQSRPNIFLFLANSTTSESSAALSEFKRAAMLVRDKVTSGRFEFADFPEAFDHFMLRGAAEKGDLPAVLIEDRQSNSIYRMDGNRVTADRVEAFFSNFSAGRLQPVVRSQEPPPGNDGPVRVIVASSFESEVSRAGRWVVVMAYSPRCESCKRLAPIYEEIGEAFRGQGVTIAKVDVTANDLPLALNRVPVVMLFKGDGSSPETYSGDQTFKEITAFVTARSGAQIAANYTIRTRAADMSVFLALVEDYPGEYQLPTSYTEERRTVRYAFYLVLSLLLVCALGTACLYSDPPTGPVAKDSDPKSGKQE
jgi:protein disulfide isomerase